MKFIKRTMSIVLTFMILMSVCNIGLPVAAIVIFKDIVVEPVSLPEAEFYCTEVTRVAKGVNSVEPGDVIVKATPSGVPELSGSYAAQAYAGETPVKTTVTFYTPKAGIQVNGMSCNNENVVISGVRYSDGKYIVTVESGTAVKKVDGTYEPLVFTVDYTWTDGRQYQEKCVSFVESIVTGGSYVDSVAEINALSGTGDTFRLSTSAFTRLLGKGVYYELPENITTSGSDPYQNYGIYDVSTGTKTEKVSVGYNTLFFSDDKTESPAGKYDLEKGVFASDIPLAHIYVDSSAVTTLADINLRLDGNTGALSSRNNSEPYTALADMWVLSGAVNWQPEEYINNETAQAELGFVFPERKNYGVTQYKENSSMETLTGKVSQYGHLFTSVFNGASSSLIDGSSYTITAKYHSYMWVKEGLLQHYNMTTTVTVPTVMTFHVVDKGVLREAVNYVMKSAPESELTNVQKKGFNPQSWYYQSGFDPFQKAYTEALTVLNNPRATQAEAEEKATALRKAYENLKLKGADYTEVNELTKKADKILQRAECYSSADIAYVNEAKRMVKKNYNLFYQSAVDTMAHNLRVAVDNATPFDADYGEIRKLEREFNAINPIDYTTDSVQLVRDIFTEVDYTLNSLDQEKIDAWAEEIRVAIDNIVPVFADFSELIRTLDEAKEIERKYFVNGDILLAPIESAENAVADNAANPWLFSKQDEINTLTEDLRQKIDGLVLKDVNKSNLKDAIDTEIPGEPRYYDRTILAEYQALTEDGTAMYDDASLTVYDQERIDAMEAAIRAKYEDLILSYSPLFVDLAELNEAILSAEDVDRNQFCNDDAMKAFDTAVEDAVSIVNEKPVITEENIQKVADAAEKIRDSIENLNLHKGKDAVEENIIPETRDEDGSCDIVVYCSLCDEELSRETVPIPASGHESAEATEENRTDPTCTEKGSCDMVVYCSCCEDKKELSRETVIIPETGHTSGEPVKENIIEKTCTEAGSYDMVTYCTVCDEVLAFESVTVPSMGHKKDSGKEENRVDSTCTQAGSYEKVFRCRACGIEMSREVYEIPVKPHDYSFVTTAPSCTEKGCTTYTCVTCGDTYISDYVDAQGHTDGEVVVENNVAPDCVNEGSYDNVTYCTVCYTETSREAIVVDAVGHIPGEWVETKAADVGVEGEETLYCVICADVLDTKVIPAIDAYFRADEDTTVVIDKERGFIYGLEEGLYDLEGFVEYKGGTLRYVKADQGFGTGTVVEFVVNGQVYESYTVVIFGDITGDGVIDTFDTAKLAQIVNLDTEIEEGSAEAFAADIIYNDGVADTYDLALLYSVVNCDITLSQA